MFQFTQISTHFKLKGGLKSIVAVTVAVGVIMTKSLTYLESGDEKNESFFPDILRLKLYISVFQPGFRQIFTGFPEKL